MVVIGVTKIEKTGTGVNGKWLSQPLAWRDHPYRRHVDYDVKEDHREKWLFFTDGGFGQYLSDQQRCSLE